MRELGPWLAAEEEPELTKEFQPVAARLGRKWAVELPSIHDYEEVIVVRITLVISSLRGGGAERVMSIMASHWAACGWRVTLLTYDDGREAPAYGLHAAVDHRHLDIERPSSGAIQAVGNNLKRLPVIRRAIRESTPDAIVSFLDMVNVKTILATLGLGIPVIVSERIDPSRHRIGAAWSVLRRWCYRYATFVVALTPDALRYFPEPIRRRGRVIPNPVSVPFDAGLARAGGRNKTVMAMGRLVHQKGFDRLITAFSMVAANHPGWSLQIWGEGNDRQELELLRDRLDLQGRVALPGWTSDPFSEMREAGLFVMSSRFEGFPNVLCEAMACGVPVLSFDCPGPRHIVRDGIDGILVPSDDVNKLAEAMDRLMADQVERERLAANGIEVAKRFGKDKVMGMWERLITSCISAH